MKNNEEEIDYTPDLYTLVDDEGKEMTFEMLDAMEYEGEKYFALTPCPDDPKELLDNDGEVVILKAVMENGEEIMASIEDDEEYEKIGNMFMERIEDMFEFEDDECDDEDCDCHKE